MPNGIEIVPYRPELREQLLALQTRLWSSDRAVNDRYLEWKYELNPDRADGLILVALRGGDVVAMRGYMGARWRFGADAATLPIPAAGDTVVAPAFEGRGLFNALNEAAYAVYRERGVRFLMNTSASAAVFLRSRRAGWRSPGPYLVLRRPADRTSATDRVLRGAEIWSSLRPLDAKRMAAGRVLRVHDTPLPREMAELANSLPTDGRLRRMRDRSYFAWRYRSPLNTYRFLVAHRGAAMDGFVVLNRRLTDEGPGLGIADWAAADEVQLVELVAVLAKAVPRASLAIWANSISERMRGQLATLGFQSTAAQAGRRFVRSLLLVSTNDRRSPADYMVADRSLLTYESWDFRLIDSDGA